jgi:hypothetical protein
MGWGELGDRQWSGDVQAGAGTSRHSGNCDDYKYPEDVLV